MVVVVGEVEAELGVEVADEGVLEGAEGDKRRKITAVHVGSFLYIH